MNDERHEELAPLYALGALPPTEARAFETAMARDPALRAMVRDFQNAAAALAHAAPLIKPPANLEGQLLAQIHAEGAAVLTPRRDHRWIAWAALAAALAILATVLGLDRQRLGGQVAVLRGKAAKAERLSRERVRLESDLAGLREKETQTAAETARLTTERTALLTEAARLNTQRTRLEGELATLQKKDAVSSVAIRTLTAQLEEVRQTLAALQEDTLNSLAVRTLAGQVDETRKTLASVAWSQDQQRGILTVEKLEPPGPAQDYQLWVIDPKAPAPVSAGLLRVDEKGGARLEFNFSAPVGSADTFAISREKKGGSAAPEGPIMLISP